MKVPLLLAFLASVLLSATAQAQQVFAHSTDHYCQALATLTTSYAKARVDGVHSDVIHARTDQADYDDPLEWDIRYITDFVYTYPHLSPSDEGNSIYSLCRDGE